MSNETPRRKHAKVYPEFEKTEVDTFLSPHTIVKDCELSAMPTVHNGILNFRRYQVTIELIDESHEVLVERLEYLWATCLNMANAETLRNAAKALDLQLTGDWGREKRR